MNERKWMPAMEAAQLMGISEQRVRKMVRRGELEGNAHFLAPELDVDAASVARWIERRERGGLKNE